MYPTESAFSSPAKCAQVGTFKHALRLIILWCPLLEEQMRKIKSSVEFFQRRMWIERWAIHRKCYQWTALRLFIRVSWTPINCGYQNTAEVGKIRSQKKHNLQMRNNLRFRGYEEEAQNQIRGYLILEDLKMELPNINYVYLPKYMHMFI